MALVVARRQPHRVPRMWKVDGREAGTAERFARYSAKFKSSGLTSDEQHLDRWLQNQAALVPGNSMGFAGIADARERADLITYQEAVGAGRMAPPDIDLSNLKEAPGQSRMTSHGGNAHRIVTGDGKTRTHWEFNLQFKTDRSPGVPAPSRIMIVGNGVHGDRAAVAFSHLEEIFTSIRKQRP